MFHPEHTMYGFILHDQSSANGSIHSRVLRTLLTANLQFLMPSLHEIMENALAEEIKKGSLTSNGTSILQHHKECEACDQ